MEYDSASCTVNVVSESTYRGMFVQYGCAGLNMYVCQTSPLCTWTGSKCVELGESSEPPPESTPPKQEPTTPTTPPTEPTPEQPTSKCAKYGSCVSCTDAGCVWCNVRGGQFRSGCYDDDTTARAEGCSSFAYFNNQCQTDKLCLQGCPFNYRCDNGRCVPDGSVTECYSPCEWKYDKGEKVCDCSSGGVDWDNPDKPRQLDCEFFTCDGKNSEACNCGGKTAQSGQYCCDATGTVANSPSSCASISGSSACEVEDKSTTPSKKMCNQQTCGGKINNAPCFCGGLEISWNGGYCCGAANEVSGDRTNCLLNSVCGGEDEFPNCNNPNCGGFVTNYPCNCGDDVINSANQYCCAYAGTYGKIGRAHV